MSKRRQAVGSDAGRAMNDLRRLQEQRTMTEAQRREAARVRAYYDIPQAVKDGIAEVASAEGLTASAVASVLLADALRRYREGRLPFAGVKRPSTSPRWEYTIEDWEILAVLKGAEALSEEAEKRTAKTSNESAVEAQAYPNGAV